MIENGGESMEDYSKLLLEAGGGIYPMQRAEYDHQTGHVLIGLGGTGIDCLKKIKKIGKNSIVFNTIQLYSYKRN